MIYTVTLNPSLDYIVSVKNFELGKTNRAASEQLFPGGKGINVSMMLRNLGFESTALGFTAGFTGEELIRRLNALDIRNEFIRLEDGLTRINLKIKNIEGTEINGRGPRVTGRELALLMEQLDRLGDGDVLFLSGSVPESMPGTVYQDISKRLTGKDVMIVADASGNLLLNVLSYQPFLIKPNIYEIQDIFGVNITKRDQIVNYAGLLQEKGARNVLVSMAGEGALLLTADGAVFDSPAPEGTLVNGVGAGDAMLAGFMAGWLDRRDYEHAFYMGLAAGSASAFSEHFAAKEDVMSLYRNCLKS